MPSPLLKPRPHTVELALRWSDADAYGHLNNSRFFTLLEEARIVGLCDWFGSHALLESGVVVLRHEIDYLTPLMYRLEPVAIDIWVTSLGASSLELGYVMRDPASVGEGVYAVAETTMAMYDPAAGRTRRIADDERAVLERFVGDPAPLRSKTARR